MAYRRLKAKEKRDGNRTKKVENAKDTLVFYRGYFTLAYQIDLGIRKQLISILKSINDVTMAVTIEGS